MKNSYIKNKRHGLRVVQTHGVYMIENGADRERLCIRGHEELRGLRDMLDALLPREKPTYAWKPRPVFPTKRAALSVILALLVMFCSDASAAKHKILSYGGKIVISDADYAVHSPVWDAQRAKKKAELLKIVRGKGGKK
jgi:hypothetical protein